MISTPKSVATMLPAVPGAFGESPLKKKVKKSFCIFNLMLTMSFGVISSVQNKSLSHHGLLRVHYWGK